MNLGKNNSIIWRFLLLMLVVVFFSGCSHAQKTADKPRDNDKATKKLPFNLSFNKDGNLIFFDEKGNKIRPKDANLPVDSYQIRSIRTISLIEVSGSCFYFIEAAGELKRIDIPEVYCGEHQDR